MSMSTIHSTDSSIDPLSQFQTLSKKVSIASRRARIKLKNSPMSPREEIYKSMLREIKSGDIPQMNSLVHKASGILRLSHYNELNKGRKVNVSWDMNGRRILTYEDKTGKEKSMLQRQSNQNSKQSLVSILNEPIFGLDSRNLKTLSEFYDTSAKSNNTYEATIGDFPPNKTVSKVWEDYIDTGDVSKLWESKEGILASESFTPSPFSSLAVSRQTSSIASLGIGTKSQAASNSEDPRPPWKTFYRMPSSTFVPSSLGGSKTENSVSASVPSMVPNRLKKPQKKDSQTNPQRKTQSSSRLVEEKKPKKDIGQEAEKIQHICVVNGSVVSFKNFGFENFTNWFGDESVLESNQKRCQPKLHLELDLYDVQNRDIRIRLFDGCKLEVEAKRRAPGASKPIRVKELFIIPPEYRVEDLLMCRTKFGKLVIEEITEEPISVNSNSSTRNTSKSKAKWIISRK